jgi:hypothetical protein
MPLRATGLKMGFTVYKSVRFLPGQSRRNGICRKRTPSYPAMRQQEAATHAQDGEDRRREAKEHVCEVVFHSIHF